MNRELDFPPFIVCPKELIFDTNITANEKMLYLLVVTLSNNAGKYCYATNSYLANLMDIHPNSISRSLQNLAKRGFLKIKTYREIDDYGHTLIERRIYPTIYLWNEPFLPTLNPHDIVKLQSNNTQKKGQQKRLMDINRNVEQINLDNINNNIYNNTKDKVCSKTKQSSNCSSSKQSLNSIHPKNIKPDEIVVKKGMKIDWDNPIFKEYQHLKPFEKAVSKWLLRVASGEIYTLKGILKIFITFYRRTQKLSAFKDAAYELKPTKDDWKDFQDLIKKKRGIKPKTFKEIRESLKSLNLPKIGKQQ